MTDAAAGEDPGQAPTCYRHPDRPTRIRCTRCDRPICPECMIPASVGFQCPDDVREGNKSMRTAKPRTLTGAAAMAQPGVITIGLVAVNVLVYVVQRSQPTFTGRFFLWGVGVEHHQYYRLLTAAFMHGGITHLAVNMVSLYIIGTQVERLVGASRYAVVYLLAAVGGTTSSFFFQGPNNQSLGASGAIFGLFGALLVITRRLRLDASQLLGLLAVNVVIGFAVPGIDWRAHAGGFVIGAAVTWAFVYAPQEARRWVHPLAVVASIAVIAVMVQARVSAKHALPGGGTALSAPLAGPDGAQRLDHLVEFRS